VGGRWGLDTRSTQYRRGYQKGGSVQFILSIGNHPSDTPHRQPLNGDAVPVSRKNEMTKTTTIASAFTTYINVDDKAQAALAAAKTALVAALAAAGITTRDAAYPLATEWAAKAYKAGDLLDGERKAKGTKVLDSTNANYEAARGARTRVLKVFEAAAVAKPADKAETVAPTTEAEKALCAAFIATCGSASRAKAVLKAFAA